MSTSSSGASSSSSSSIHRGGPPPPWSAKLNVHTWNWYKKEQKNNVLFKKVYGHILHVWICMVWCEKFIERQNRDWPTADAKSISGFFSVFFFAGKGRRFRRCCRQCTMKPLLALHNSQVRTPLKWCGVCGKKNERDSIVSPSLQRALPMISLEKKRQSQLNGKPTVIRKLIQILRVFSFFSCGE